MKRNTKLLKAVAEYIRTDPSSYNQQSWISFTEEGEQATPDANWEDLMFIQGTEEEVDAKLAKSVYAGCNTACCISGTGILLDEGLTLNPEKHPDSTGQGFYVDYRVIDNKTGDDIGEFEVVAGELMGGRFGLTADESARLFDWAMVPLGFGWSYAEGYVAEPEPAEYANAVADVLDAIAEGGEVAQLVGLGTAGWVVT